MGKFSKTILILLFGVYFRLGVFALNSNSLPIITLESIQDHNYIVMEEGEQYIIIELDGKLFYVKKNNK